MSQRIIFMNENDVLSVVVPTSEWTGTMFELAERTVPPGVAYDIVDESAIPGDREFRNGWVKNGSKVDISLAKAKEIVKDRIREERAPELLRLDVAALRAQEQGDAAKYDQIVAEKNALRDATAHPRIVNAKSIDELRGLTLSDVK